MPDYTDNERCPCGRPLHYSNQQCEDDVRAMIKEWGRFVKVSAGGKTWEVPRHYIALHGLKAAELPYLAERYQFKEVEE